jgi:hypothetical protein
VWEAAVARSAAVTQAGRWASPAGWEECKTEEELEKLSEKSPSRYCRDELGTWHCPPGEAHAGELGLYYRVRSSREINWVLQRNLQFMEDYFSHGFPPGRPRGPGVGTGDGVG